ncbi:o-succinylbenzoate synthase [Maribacter sp. 4G9]|uniref:o-succinylbenzoate synthase n=1 Tax=Maribacter sp. 4G9 TaxID=1889777 RepID=UPI000C15600E|nr:o-succinylbenzoate synthase [Maribacter sp. 4G9]PIB22979.1 o-succinylbenzoate synthase [Maribacter sp. 4G9]
MKASFKKYILNFKRPSGTSRGVLRIKETWFVILENEGKLGIGECGLFRGLSYDDVPHYEEKCRWVEDNIQRGKSVLLRELMNYPSIQFGLEQAYISLENENPFELFQTSFLLENKPIPINGLIWMGDAEYIKDQIAEKLEQGFSCIKMKIGAIDFNEELRLLELIRKDFSSDQIELRVDANGAFTPNQALQQMVELAQFQLHSIEQPIKQGNWQAMKDLCEKTPLPIALDEELIGVIHKSKKRELLRVIAPQYIILKPSLVGGFEGSKEWIDLAEKSGIGWWITSALESNIGLNAIAQWTSTLQNNMPQGLGTGALFTNNFESPLEVKKGGLYYNRQHSWENNLIESLCI